MSLPETALGPPVVDWLAAESWEVYQEVEAVAGCADLVATRGTALAVVELKVQLSWELLAQAVRWRGWAHQVWVATPRPDREGDGRRMALRCFEQNGIGVLQVRWPSSPHAFVEIAARPAFDRMAQADRIRKVLRPEHQTFAAAGSPTGARWTPYKATCAAVLAYVQKNPGALLGDVVAQIDHHYRGDKGAKATLAARIEHGLVPGVVLRRDGRRLRVDPAPAQEGKVQP